MSTFQDFRLEAEAHEAFQTNRFVHLEGVLDPAWLAPHAREITRLVLELNTNRQPLHLRDTYSRAFLQVMNLWRESEIVREFVFNRRLARIAAGLLGVPSVRLYHDQALYKEPGGGHTPWHADQFYWPLATDRTVTAWIPLQDTPLEMGPLEFASGSHVLEGGRALGISDESEAAIGTMLREHGYPVRVEPFALGDVSFHSGWLYHRAGPNRTGSPRGVMTIIYMDAAMVLKDPENDNQRLDWQTWCPGARVGEVIDTPLNPVLC
ncbi:MAG: phytanoyl-CoA dioxygenase [Rhodothermales bacterium]|nr:phytanoyl-CoA dioxygenase [Rhodothermales bacterium]